jgi:hypothetical protein
VVGPFPRILKTMLEPAIPDDEEKRLALLKACNIIYTPGEQAYDDVARLHRRLQVRRARRRRADWRPMGTVLYELVTGAHPFRGSADQRSEVPAATEAIVFRCLQRPPEERFESMAALARPLRSA